MFADQASFIKQFRGNSSRKKLVQTEPPPPVARSLTRTLTHLSRDTPPVTFCKMISYFKIFVYSLFPPAALLMGLLLLPFPPRVAKAVVQLCDAFLFLQPHPHVPISLFWLVLLISTVTFFIHLDEMNTLRQQYRGKEYSYTLEDKDRLLIKLLAEERNSWISGCCLALWIGVHRYRSLLKKFYRLEDESRSKRLDGPAQVVPVAVDASVEIPTSGATKKEQ